MKTILIISLSLTLLVFVNCSTHAQYAVPHSVFDMGFGMWLSPNTVFKSVTGQPFVGSSTGTNVLVTSGFLLGSDYIVGVEEQTLIPVEYQLYQNYPNPFNPTTTISYDLPKAGAVSIRVFNIIGQEVATILDEVKEAGSHKFAFSASNLASGAYFYRIQAGGFVRTKKMLIVK